MRRSLNTATVIILMAMIPNTLVAERQVTLTETGTIVASDLAEMQEFATTQHENLVDQLKVADDLSAEQKALVAIALSKDFEGLPVCSFEQAIAYQTETDKNETRMVTVHENGFLTDNTGRNRMFREWRYSPFAAPPAIGMDFATGIVLHETETDVTFQFRFNKKAKSASEKVNELLKDLRRVPKHLRYELVVDIETGEPKSLVLELTKPTRVMVVAKVQKIRYEYTYQFDETMQRYTIPNQVFEFAYSAPTRGTVEEKIEVTYSNFQCDTPVRYMWAE